MINKQRGKREGVTDGEKLGPASEYNQFSYEPLFPTAMPENPHPLCFPVKVKQEMKPSHTAAQHNRPLSALIHH